MAKYTLTLKNGVVKTFGGKTRDKSHSKKVRAERILREQTKGKTNIGNPRDKGMPGVKSGAFDPKSKSHQKKTRKMHNKKGGK